MNAIAAAKYIMDGVTDDSVHDEYNMMMNVVVMNEYMMIYLYKYLYRLL